MRALRKITTQASAVHVHRTLGHRILGSQCEFSCIEIRHAGVGIFVRKRQRPVQGQAARTAQDTGIAGAGVVIADRKPHRVASVVLEGKVVTQAGAGSREPAEVEGVA